MKKLTIIACAALILASCNDKKAGAKVPMKTLKDSFSYAFGTFVGAHMLKVNNIEEINWEVFKSAVETSIKNGDSALALDKTTIDRVINDYLAESKYGENKKNGEEYIAKRKGDGFKTSASGLLYKQLKPGNGVKPNITDTVLVYYTGKLPNGKVFDSNEGKSPFKTAINGGAIEGFLEALAMMDEGSEYEVIIPYDLAYGKTGMPNPYGGGEMIMEPYQTLTFTIKMVGIKR